MNAREEFLDLLKKNKEGKATGVYSICSAQKNVLQACMNQAKEDGSMLLVESTSNQVDQFGGYTGMKPADFVAYVYSIADTVGFDKDRLLLGGDHLGPNTWQNEPASEAMPKALDLVAEYVKAGYLKIHLDASMFCADDKGDRHAPLADEVVATRAAQMAEVAEKTWKEMGGDPSKAPVYIIGTEVPVPGGAQEEEETVQPTSPADAEKTIAVTKAAFQEKGLNDAWSRVCGVVVQPGVEFGDAQVFHYGREAAKDLTQVITKYDGFVFEAHSTDYQSEKGLTQLVEDYYCILKVGPWVTFAYREALFALADMEQELLSLTGTALSNFKTVVETVMLEEPKYWQKYYPGDEKEKLIKRMYSFSDRSRYYWPNEKIEAARAKLFKNLTENEIPLSMLSQYLPNQYTAVSNGECTLKPEDLVESKIRDICGIYARACNLSDR